MSTLPSSQVHIAKFVSLHDPHIDKFPSFPSFSSLQMYIAKFFNYANLHIAKLSKFPNTPFVLFSFSLGDLG
jgi:hypothetical protein